MADRPPRWRTPDEAATPEGRRLPESFMRAIRDFLSGVAVVGPVAGVLVVCPGCRGPLAGLSDGWPQAIPVADISRPDGRGGSARIAIFPLHCWLHRPTVEDGDPEGGAS
jgi:hypothetical protein